MENKDMRASDASTVRAGDVDANEALATKGDRAADDLVAEAGQAAAFIATLQRNPAGRNVYRALLEEARDEVPRAELATFAQTLAWPKSFVLTAQGAIGVLVKKGMLGEAIYVDGARYEGTRAQLEQDESVGADAQVTYAVQTTSAGVRVLEDLGDRGLLERLVQRRPQYADGFLAVLNSCSRTEGRSRDELAQLLEGGGYLPIDPATGMPSIYPAYVLDKLEEIGAIVWKDRAWYLTDLGERFLGAA